MNEAILLLGSNIDSINNLDRAIKLLQSSVKILQVSNTWETESVGFPGPNFLNLAVAIISNKSQSEIKEEIIGKIENSLGRIRTEDKNSPRTIDIDIIIFNNIIIDNNLWERDYIALPVADLLPNLNNPSGKKLSFIVQKLMESSHVKNRLENKHE